MPVLLQEGHLLHARRACSQIQKGPFFFFNTHALHSCGSKQIYIKIKYSSPSHAFHSPHPFPFHPHSTPFPSPAHSPLSVTPRTCSPVTLSPLAYNLFSRLPVHSSTYNVTHRTCSSVTMSIKHPTCPPVSPSTRQLTMLLIELVHLLPCLLIQLTCSLVHSLTRLLVNYFYHLTFLSVLVQNTATQILPFLSPTSTVKNITINNTSH